MAFALRSRVPPSFVALLVAGLALASAPAAAQSVANFYRGRTISFVVGFGPGGGYDLYARLISRHIGRPILGEKGGWSPVRRRDVRAQWPVVGAPSRS